MGASAYIVAIAAVVAAGASVYSAMNQPDAPDIPPPPPPANYEQYDDEGNLMTVQVWNADKHAYETKFDPEPAYAYGVGGSQPERRAGTAGSQVGWYNQQTGKPLETNPSSGNYESERTDMRENPSNWIWKETIPRTPAETDAEYAARVEAWKKTKAESPEHQAWQARKDERIKNKQTWKEIEDKALTNINQTPAETVQAADAYAKTYGDILHKDVDKQFAEADRARRERMEATGMTGSKADVDLAAEYAGKKTEADTTIAQQAEMAKQGYLDRNRQWWMGLLNAAEQKRSNKAITAMQQAKTASDIAYQGTVPLMATYTTGVNNQMTKYGIDVEKNAAMTNTFGGLAGSLGMMYAYGGNRGSNITPSSPRTATDYGSTYRMS